VYLTSGFVLSAQAHDSAQGLQYEIWFATDNGPIKTISENETALFFIKNSDTKAAQAILSAESLNFLIKPLSLKNFQQQDMCGCYFYSLKHFYSASKALKSRGITLYEDDIRPIERYLMERFIKGGAWITGKRVDHAHYTEILDAKLKTNADYTPELSKLSLDIECNESGVLFSIGLVGCGLDCVIMIGEPEHHEPVIGYTIIWCADEVALLQQLVTLIKQCDPDIIIGWNVIEFDFAVIYERSFTRVSIPGRCVIDGIDTLKNATYSFETFSLANVAKEILGESKLIESSNSLQEIIRQFNELQSPRLHTR